MSSSGVNHAWSAAASASGSEPLGAPRMRSSVPPYAATVLSIQRGQAGIVRGRPEGRFDLARHPIDQPPATPASSRSSGKTPPLDVPTSSSTSWTVIRS